MDEICLKKENFVLICYWSRLRCSSLTIRRLLKNLILLSALSVCLPTATYAVEEFWHDSIQPTRSYAQTPAQPTFAPEFTNLNSIINDYVLPNSNATSGLSSFGSDRIESNKSNSNSIFNNRVENNDFSGYSQYSDYTTENDNSDEEMGSLYRLEQEKLAKEQAIIRHIEIVGANNVSNELIRQQMQLQAGGNYARDLLMNDLKSIYDMGYFTENMKAFPTINDDGTVDVQIVLEENMPITDFTIEGNTVVSTEEILEVLMPIKGKPQNMGMLNQALTDVQKLYIDKGYILCRIDSVTDDPDGTVNIVLVEGKINKIFITGNKKTKDFVIERNILAEPGMVYNENMIKEDLTRLYSTQAFKDVTRQLEPTEENPDLFDLTINVEEQRSATISAGGGVDTVTGLFGSVGISDNNFLGRGQRLSLNGLAGTGMILNDASIKRRMNLQVELSFFEPHFLNADTSFLSKAYYRDFGSYQIPLAIERRIGGEVTIAHRMRSNRHMTSTFTLGLEHINVSEGDKDKMASLFAQNHVPIAERAKQLEGGLFLSLSPGLMYDTRDNETVTRRGTMASLRFDEEFGILDFKKTHGKISGMVKHYIPIRKKSSLSFMFKGGGKIHGDMPEVMAYRLGGPYSIRGFKMSGVGTGDAFIMGSAELATPLPLLDRTKINFLHNLRFTMFVDAGKVFGTTVSDKIYDRPMYAVTAGVGLKLYIPGMGPLSVDYGFPLTNPGRSNNRAGYFTFGVGDLMY